MLVQLKAIHEELRQAIAALAIETARMAPHDETLALARLRLSRASHRRRSLIETSIYPRADRFAQEDRRKVEALRLEAADLLAGSSVHITRWTMPAIRMDWAGYQGASGGMRRAMLRRIAAEAAILYPLLSGSDDPASSAT